MDIPGYTLLLQDFCEYCPDFEAEVEDINCMACGDFSPKMHHYIRCTNQKRCARIAENISRQVTANGR